MHSGRGSTLGPGLLTYWNHKCQKKLQDKNQHWFFCKYQHEAAKYSCIRCIPGKLPLKLVANDICFTLPPSTLAASGYLMCVGLHVQLCLCCTLAFWSDESVSHWDRYSYCWLIYRTNICISGAELAQFYHTSCEFVGKMFMGMLIQLKSKQIYDKQMVDHTLVCWWFMINLKNPTT